MKTTALKRLTRTPPKNGLGLAGSEDNPEDPRYIRITDIGDNGQLRKDTFASQPRHVAATSQVVPGDVLIASVGATVGKSYLHRGEGEFCFAGFLSRVRPKPDELLPDYLFYWTQSGHYWDQVRRGTVSSTIENFSAGKIGELRIPHLPLRQQRIIADSLDHETAEIDTFIADLEELLSITARRKWAVIDQAYLNAASLAEHVRLRHLATFNPSAPRSYVQTGAPFRLLPMEAIHEFGPPSDGVTKTYDELKIGYSYIGTSDVAFAKVTPCFENGKGVTGCNLYEDVFATTEVTVVRPDSEVDQRYLAIMFQTEAFRGPGIASMTGAGGLKRVPDDYVRNFRIPLPSIPEQVRMARDVESELADLCKIQRDVKNAVALSKERRSALISAAVMGQIDITQKHRPVAERLEDEVKQPS